MGYRLKEGNLREATFTKPEGSQSGGVKIFFFLIRRVRIRRGLIFATSEGSQSGWVLYLLTQSASNPEGSKFCKSGRVLFLPIRRCIILLKDLGKQKKDYSERYYVISRQASNQ